MSRVVAITRKVRERGLLLIGLLLCLAGAPQTRAQVVGGTILGTITDSSGAVVPEAQISIRNLANGTIRSVKTDAAGFYAAPNLLPGVYEVTASAAGLATTVEQRQHFDGWQRNRS